MADEEKTENEMTVKIKYEDDGKGKWQSVSARIEVDGDDYFLTGIEGFGETKEEAKEDLKSKIIPLLVQVRNVLQLGKPKWHDLRKNPNDVPEECQNVLCMCNDIGYKYYCTGHLIYKTWLTNIVSKKLRVIAWCELPKFEE